MGCEAVEKMLVGRRERLLSAPCLPHFLPGPSAGRRDQEPIDVEAEQGKDKRAVGRYADLSVVMRECTEKSLGACAPLTN